MGYSKYKDVHTLTNTGTANMPYSLTKINCDTTVTILSGTILPTKSITLNFKTDGDYQLDYTLYTGAGGMFSLETSENILYYNNLVNSFITSAEGVLCGCTPCPTCEECNDCEDYLESFVKASAISSLTYPLYEAYTKAIVEDSKCEFSDAILCSLLKEKVYGNFEVKDAMLKILSYYYAAFYYKDHILAVDASEKDYVTTKYKFDKISKCIKKLGVDPKETLDKLEEGTMVYYWQLNNVQDDITEVVPLITPSYLTSKLSKTYEIFEQGYIVQYNLIGRIVFAIASTQVVNFAITDALNNDITDEFDKDISIPNTVVYVSKNPYSYSSIYFKFKKTL